LRAGGSSGGVSVGHSPEAGRQTPRAAARFLGSALNKVRAPLTFDNARAQRPTKDPLAFGSDRARSNASETFNPRGPLLLPYPCNRRLGFYDRAARKGPDRGYSPPPRKVAAVRYPWETAVWKCPFEGTSCGRVKHQRSCRTDRSWSVDLWPGRNFGIGPSCRPLKPLN
jgi:hypothetical protein